MNFYFGLCEKLIYFIVFLDIIKLYLYLSILEL